MESKEQEKYKREMLESFEFPNHSIEKLIQMFDNGFERYQQDALFNRCIDTIHRGENPIKILDQVLKIQKDTQEQYEKILRYSPLLPTMIIKED